MNKRKLLTDRQRLLQCHDGQRTLRLFGDRLDRPTLGAVRAMLSPERKDIHRRTARTTNANDNGAGPMQGCRP